MVQTKRQKAIDIAVVPGKAYGIDEAIKILKTATKAKFIESVDVAIRLGVDVKSRINRSEARLCCPLELVGMYVSLCLFHLALKLRML